MFGMHVYCLFVRLFNVWFADCYNAGGGSAGSVPTVGSSKGVMMYGVSGV